MPFEERAHVEEGICQPLTFAEEQRNQQAAHTAVVIAERMDRFEFSRYFRFLGDRRQYFSLNAST
jgi:hypothetical protein